MRNTIAILVFAALSASCKQHPDACGQCANARFEVAQDGDGGTYFGCTPDPETPGVESRGLPGSPGDFYSCDSGYFYTSQLDSGCISRAVCPPGKKWNTPIADTPDEQRVEE